MKRFWRLYRPHYRETRRLALPVIIAQVGQITVGLADSMMIGHLGKTPLAAAAFANTLFSLPLIFGMGFAMAITPLIGNALGKEKWQDLITLKKSAFISNMMMALVLIGATAGLYVAMPHMRQPESILPLSQPYFIIIGCSIIPLMIFLAGKQVAEGLSNTRIAMYITITANILNIIGNYLLIKGHWGFPELGLNGAGISTLLARIVMAFLMIIAMRKMPLLQKYSRQFKTKNTVHHLKSLYKLGLPMGLHMFAEASAFIMAGIMMGWISETGLAAHQIVMSLSTFGFMLYQGIGISTTIRVSQLTARQVPALVKRASSASIQVVVVMVIIISSLFLILRHWLPQLFTNEPDVIALASQLIVILVIFQLFDAFQIIYSGILRGMSDAKVPGLLTFISYFVVAIPFSYWAAFHGGFKEQGIWFGFPLGLGVCAVLFYFRINRLMQVQLKQVKASR